MSHWRLDISNDCETTEWRFVQSMKKIKRDHRMFKYILLAPKQWPVKWWSAQPAGLRWQVGLLEIISAVVNPRDLQHNNVCTQSARCIAARDTAGISRHWMFLWVNISRDDWTQSTMNQREKTTLQIINLLTVTQTRAVSVSGAPLRIPECQCGARWG